MGEHSFCTDPCSLILHPLAMSEDKSSKRRPEVSRLFAQIKQFWAAGVLAWIGIGAHLIFLSISLPIWGPDTRHYRNLASTMFSSFVLYLLWCYRTEKQLIHGIPLNGRQRKVSPFRLSHLWFYWLLFGSPRTFSQMGQFWVMGVLAGIGSELCRGEKDY